MSDESGPVRPRCPRCAVPDEVDVSGVRNVRWYCGTCELAFVGSADEWRRYAPERIRYLSTPKPEPKTFDLEAMSRDFVEEISDLDDDTASGLAPASVVFARIAANFAMTNPEAEGAAVVFAAEAFTSFLAATGARPTIDGSPRWELDLDPGSISEEFLERVETLHGFLSELTDEGTNITVTTGDDLSDPTGGEGETEPDTPGTPETTNQELSRPNLTLLDGGIRTPLGGSRS